MGKKLKRNKTKAQYDRERLKMIFEYSPIAIWEEDFSALSQLRQKLDQKKVKSIRPFLFKHPKLVLDTFRKIKVLDVNKAAIALYGARSKKHLLDNLGKTVHKETVRVLAGEFASLLEGEEYFEAEFKSRKLNGKLQDVKMTVCVPKFYKKSFKRVIVTLQDISVQKKHERHLKRLAQTDSMTKVLNHSAIGYRLEGEFKRAKRYHLSLSCLMLDLDHFKKVNDRFGHQVGDQVLKRTADVLRKYLREVDIIGRYGGDEFLIILPETSLENAEVVALRIKDMFNTLANKKRSRMITASIGICGYPSRSIKSAKDLIAKVDKAMYSAKKAGRNRIALV